MGATQVSKVGMPQEVNFNDLFVTDIGTDGVVNAGTATVDGIMPMPEVNVMDTTSNWDNMTNFFNSGGATGKESGGSLGSTLQGVGAITGALASVYGISEQKKYQKEVLNMEKERVAKNEARRDTKQAEYDKVWGGDDTQVS